MLASVADLADNFELRVQASNLTDQIGLTEGNARVTPSGIINGIETGRPIFGHGSRADTSSKRRCGLTSRHIPTATRIVSSEPWPSAFLLRGVAVPDVNIYLLLPKYREGKHTFFQPQTSAVARLL
jgi:hypothetical protein